MRILTHRVKRAKTALYAFRAKNVSGHHPTPNSSTTGKEVADLAIVTRQGTVTDLATTAHRAK